jgi:hypothetical protein
MEESLSVSEQASEQLLDSPSLKNHKTLLYTSKKVVLRKKNDQWRHATKNTR